MIVTCPKFESDGPTFSPLAGQAMRNNLYPGPLWCRDRARGRSDRTRRGVDADQHSEPRLTIRSCVSASPATSRNSDRRAITFSIGFANPKIINDRLAERFRRRDGVSCGTNWEVK